MRIAKEIEQEAKLSSELIEAGFEHVLKAGELIAEVESIVKSEEELQGWLKENCSNLDLSILKNARRLYRGEEVTIYVITKQKEKEPKEPQKRKRLS